MPDIATLSGPSQRIYGRTLTERQKRQDELYEQLEAGQHLSNFNICLVIMHELAGREEMTQKDRDRFSSYKALADQHWKVVDRYLPKQKVNDSANDIDESQQRGSLEALHQIIANLTPRKPDPSQAQSQAIASTNESTEGQQ